MVSRETIENNSTEENLKLLDSMSWKSEWNGEYSEEVRGYDNYFNEAKMVMEELKKRGVEVGLYEELWKLEKEGMGLRSENYKEYEKQKKEFKFLKTGQEWIKKLNHLNKSKNE